MRCARCGTSSKTIAEHLSHACIPFSSKVDELGWQAVVADERDHGPGREQESRFHDGAGKLVVKKGLYGEPEERIVDRTGAALEAELKAGGTPIFDAEAEVPKDRYDRTEFKAKDWRFPREQVAKAGPLPMDRGLVTYRLTPEELAEYKLTGVMPDVGESRKTLVRGPDEPSL